MSGITNLDLLFSSLWKDVFVLFLHGANRCTLDSNGLTDRGYKAVKSGWRRIVTSLTDSLAGCCKPVRILYILIEADLEKEDCFLRGLGVHWTWNVGIWKWYEGAECWTGRNLSLDTRLGGALPLNRVLVDWRVLYTTIVCWRFRFDSGFDILSCQLIIHNFIAFYWILEREIIYLSREELGKFEYLRWFHILWQVLFCLKW